ncbi:MAG: RNA polymerase sigma factor [Candidatus Dojkabacteria bacterium]
MHTDFENFYRKTYSYVYVFFSSRVFDKSHSDDLCQTVYLKFYKKFSKQEHFDETSLKILFGFCRNEFKEYLRIQGKSREVDYIEDFQYTVTNDSDEYQQPNPYLELIKHSLIKLHPTTRKVIEYKYFYRMSHREIAVLVGIRESSVSKIVQRGVRYLKKACETGS